MSDEQPWEDEYCPECGQPVEEGSWPFCKSAKNPDGHSREVGYGWHFGG